MPKKVSFQVVHCSGADEGHNAKELEFHSPTTKGWQSSRFCLYPQEVVLMLKDTQRIRKLQVLAHQYLIPTKIEIFIGRVPIGQPASLLTCKYKRLGYVGLSNNEKTEFKARELKSIHLDAEGQFVKLLIHKNHVNRYNLYNQVNVVAVNVLADPHDNMYDDPLDPDPLKGVDNIVQRYMKPNNTFAAMTGDPIWGKINRIIFVRVENLWHRVMVMVRNQRHVHKITAGMLGHGTGHLGDDTVTHVMVILNTLNKGSKLQTIEGVPARTAPEFVSPLDDLAFDMYQDPETAELIRKLEAKKREAVQNERYEYAKKLKMVVADLYKVGEKLGKYEIEKKRAVEQEDYDLAQEKKKQSDEFRLYVYKQLNITELLELDGKQYSEPVNLHITSPLPPIPSERTPPPHPPQQQEMRTSPPLKPLTVKPYVSPEQKKPEQVSPRLPEEDHLDERPLPALNKSKPEDDEEEAETSPHSSDGPEPLKDNDARVASSAIAVFGEYLVQCSYSKQWKFRQEAMEQLDKEMTSPSPELSHDQDPRSVTRATVFLLKKGIKEKVQSVLVSCLTVLSSLLLTYIPKHKLGKGEIQQVVEKVVPALLVKSGEMTPRSREAAIDMIIEMAKYDDILPHGTIPDIVTQPFKAKPPPPWRLYKSRLEIIEKLLAVLELDTNKPGCLHVSSIMQVTIPALNHNNGDVRDTAIKLIFELYKKVKEPIKSYLPPDEPATRKNPLYRAIFDGFDHIDGKPTESERRAQVKQDRKQAEKSKQSEIEALQAQLQALRDMAQGGAAATNATESKSNKVTKKPKDDTPNQSIEMDRMCIFCGEKNQTFTEEVLDLHYWKSCPMLKRCDQCSQVVEVSGFNEHLLSECDAKDKFSQCPRCKDVFLSVDLEEHITEGMCTAPKGSQDAQRCPLCRTEIGDAEEAWHSHLMDNCKPNKLRLQQQQASKAPSRASVRSNRGRGGKATPSTRGATRGRKGNMPR